MGDMIICDMAHDHISTPRIRRIDAVGADFWEERRPSQIRRGVVECCSTLTHIGPSLAKFGQN